jgi:hypothetical protein
VEQAINDELQQAQDPSVEIMPTEDGGAEISFDPNIASPMGGEDHYSNLAEFLDEDVLVYIGSDLQEKYTDYKTSRQDWEQAYTRGLDLLGFKYES